MVVNRAAEIGGNFLNNIPTFLPNSQSDNFFVCISEVKPCTSSVASIRNINRRGGRKRNQLRPKAHIYHPAIFCADGSGKNRRDRERDPEKAAEIVVKLTQ